MRSTLIMVSVLLLAAAAHAQMYQTVTADQAQLLQDGPGRLYCPNCGMHLIKFYRTGHALTGAGGQTAQYCSLHCLVEANAELGGQVQVVDNTSLKFVPATGAHYVVGSDRPGTMTMNSKYAFAERADAAAFAAEHGGQVVGFAEAEQIARAGLDRENEMIRGKRAKAAEKGRAIVTRLAPDARWPAFGSIAEAKAHLAGSEVFGSLKDDQLQAAAIYLATGRQEAAGPAAVLAVPEQARCPVCGMFVAKYPKWAASAEVRGQGRFYFDGVKDLMKFYFQPARYEVEAAAEDFLQVLVTDYYTLRAVPARQAWYVTGSNVYGPMGDELVPFAGEKDARTFQQDHFGKQVLRFADITEELVQQLDR